MILIIPWTIGFAKLGDFENRFQGPSLNPPGFPLQKRCLFAQSLEQVQVDGKKISFEQYTLLMGHVELEFCIFHLNQLA